MLYYVFSKQVIWGSSWGRGFRFHCLEESEKGEVLPREVGTLRYSFVHQMHTCICISFAREDPCCIQLQRHIGCFCICPGQVVMPLTLTEALLVKCPSVQWQPDGLTTHTKKWFLGAGFLGSPPISLLWCGG